jgi:predicted cytidylate kinase
MKKNEKRIILSGFAGTGKTTVGKILAEKLKYEFISVGDFSRQFAFKNYGLTINEFQQKCKDEPELDKQIDEKFQEYCNNKEKLVIDYRLGFKFIKNSFNVFLSVSDEIAINRIKNSNRQNEKIDSQSISNRNSEMKNRFMILYGVDFTDEKFYDLKLSTDGQSPETIADEIINEFNKCNK